MTDRTDFQATLTTSLPTGGRNSAEDVRGVFSEMADAVVFLDEHSGTVTELADLDTVVTGAELDAMQTKLADIDALASATLHGLTDVDDTAATPTDGDILVFRTAGGDWVLEPKPATEGSPSWGDIAGTLAAQTDLQAALDALAVNSRTVEQSEDLVATMFLSGAHTGIGVNYNDAGSAIDLAAVTASTTVPGIVELATSGETTTGSDTARAVTPAGLAAVTAALKVSGADETANVTTASTSAAGKVELATDAETRTGTDTARAVTPAGLEAAQARVPFVAVASSRALVVTDRGKVLRVTASSTLTVNTSIFAEGDVVGIRPIGGGVVATIADGTCTVTPVTGYAQTISVSGATAFLHFVSASAADLNGGLDLA